MEKVIYGYKVYVYEKLLDEPFIYQPTSQSGDVQFPVTVDEDCVFVLGDNRNNSRDSRFSDVGMVSEDDIIGKAVLSSRFRISAHLIDKKSLYLLADSFLRRL